MVTPKGASSRRWRWQVYYRRLSRMVERVFGIPNSVSLPYVVTSELRQQLALMVARLMLVFGVPVNVILAILFYQQIYVAGVYPVSASYNHAFWFFVGSSVALFFLYKEKGVLAIYSIIVAAFASVFIQMYIVNDVGVFVGMLLIMATPTIVLTVQENIRICFLLVVGAAIMRFGFGLAGDFWGAVLVFLSIELSFVTFGEGVRRVLRQTIAEQRTAASTAVRSQAEAVYVKELSTEREKLAREQTRTGIARHLHDTVQQVFVALSLHIEGVLGWLEKDNHHQVRLKLAQAQHLTDEGLHALRQTVHRLEGPDLSITDVAYPLSIHLEKIGSRWESAGLTTKLEIIGTEYVLTPAAIDVLTSVVREAYTNIAKHARAKQVELLLDYSRLDRVRLVVRDDGQGTQKPVYGSGLTHLDARVQQQGGQLRISTASGEGFELIVEIPV